MTVDLTVLSLGAGVQSSTVALMACRGDLPGLQAAIFADTQGEPPEVYAHLDWLQGQLEAAGIPLHRVTAGSLIQATQKATGAPTLPLYVTNPNGTAGHVGMRSCTRDYKTRPIERQQRAMLGDRTKGKHVEVWLGISRDEIQRMRDAKNKWQTNRYPLIDLGMTRHDCLRWLDFNGYPQPPKSACLYCPYRRDNWWRSLRQRPDLWAEAVAADEAIRHPNGISGVGYLHRQRVPLPLVDLSTPEDRGQGAMWDRDDFTEECEGLCGV